ncbi:MAG: helix-turn-helix transcriptional regulator [Bacteroidota bacterium]
MSSVQVNILLLCLGAIQGVFLFLLLFKKRHSLPGYAFLAGYFAVMLMQIAMKIASKLWLMQNTGALYSLSYYLPFLYGPLIYLFVCKVTGKRQVNKKDVLHFVPFILILSVFAFGEPRMKVPVILVPLFHTVWSMILQLVSLAVYHCLAYYNLNKESSSSMSHMTQYRIKWLKQFVASSFVVCSAIAVVICLMYYHFPHWQNIRFGFTALTVFIYWISYKAWSQPELFSFVRGYSNEPVDRSVIPALRVHLPLKKYSNSGLAEDDMQRIITALENKMHFDKLYLDEGLTIDLLAENLGCSKHHLSQVLNERLNKSFYDYINHFRVEEAKLMLSDPAKVNHKIAAIAYDSGFNSISTFNDVFKKISGTTPSQYRKQREEKALQKQRV